MKSNKQSYKANLTFLGRLPACTTLPALNLFFLFFCFFNAGMELPYVVKTSLFLSFSLTSALLALRFLQEAQRAEPVLLTTAVLSAYCLIITINGIYETPILTATLTLNTVPLFCAASSPNRFSHIDPHFLLKSISISFLFLLLAEIHGRYTIYQQIISDSYNYIDFEREIFRLSGNNFNPNRWSASIFPLFLSSYYFYIKNPKSLTPKIATLFIYIYGMASLSKTFAITSTISIITLHIITQTCKLKSAINISLLLGTLFTILFLLKDTIYINRIIEIFSILSNPTEDSTVSVRLETYREALNHINNHPITGVHYDQTNGSPHNNFLAHWTFYGFPGIFLFSILFIFPFLRTACANGTKPLIWIAFVLLTNLSSSMSSLATDTVAQNTFIISSTLSIIIVNNATYRNNISSSKNGE